MLIIRYHIYHPCSQSALWPLKYAEKFCNRKMLHFVYAKIPQNYLTKECSLLPRPSFQSNLLAGHRNNGLQRKLWERVSWEKQLFIQLTSEPTAHSDAPSNTPPHPPGTGVL